MVAADQGLAERIRKAKRSRTWSGVGMIGCGVFFLAIGCFSNTAAQREFNRYMASRPTIADPVIKNIAPLNAARAASTGLMDLMPFVFLLLGVGSLGYGGYQAFTDIPEDGVGKISKKFATEKQVDRLKAVRRANGARPAGTLEFSGLYISQPVQRGKAHFRECLMFDGPSGVYVVQSEQSAVDIFIDHFEKRDNLTKIPYARTANEVTFSTSSGKYRLKLWTDKHTLEVAYSNTNTLALNCEFIDFGIPTAGA